MKDSIKFAVSTASAIITAIAVGFFGTGALLGIVFIALKVMGYLTWAWIWVLAPIWIPVLIIIIGTIVACAFFASLY